MFDGTIPALITPFEETSSPRPKIDYESFAELIEWQLECGVSAVLPCGTSGESTTLEPEEKLELIGKTIEIVKGRVPVIAGTGSNDTAKTIELTLAAKKLGASAALIVSPYYNRPTQEGLYQHFRAVAEQGGLPIMLYNIPSRSAVEIEIPTLERLAKVPGVIGVKHAVDSATKLIELVESVGDSLPIFAGSCELTYFVLSVGGKGVVSASANAIPKEMVEITTQAQKGNLAEACKAQLRALRAIRALFAETNPAPAKAALHMLGRIKSEKLRLPLVPVTQETRNLLSSALGLENS